ncbi:hypothetical protein K3495_g13208 [Podosphaera aphanis]|nr:hypothetical protein K3495_g13208 [Podosphaera aphanis]
MAEKYLLQVTAGSSYDPADHQIVPVNVAEPITIDTEHITADLNVRIKSYRGLPLSSPSSSAYFSLPDHAKSDDKYSISFAFTLKSTINGNDLVFGNDFDYPIRDRLPLGFGTAFRIVKWMIDPGLDGDVYADQPHLYGPVASSFNVLYVGDKGDQNRRKKIDEEAGLLFSEGGSENGIALRKEKGVPDSEGSRKKYFLNELNRKEWDWEAGREYGLDFFNPYLDFNGIHTLLLANSLA